MKNDPAFTYEETVQVNVMSFLMIMTFIHKMTQTLFHMFFSPFHFESQIGYQRWCLSMDPH